MDIFDPDVLSTGAGMAFLLAGRKLTGVSLFARGIYNLERRWWQAHPETPRELSARWRAATEFYETSHQNARNRNLHRIGIPLIIGGTIGLLAFRPYRPVWAIAATAFSVGWAVNFIGHYAEKTSPAFADDPLSFVAGPVWDWKQRKQASPAMASGIETRN